MAQQKRRQGWQIFIERYPEVRLLWDTDAGAGHMRAFSLKGKVVLIHDYGVNGADGWTVYVDPFTSMNTEETLTQIERFTNGEIGLIGLA